MNLRNIFNKSTAVATTLAAAAVLTACQSTPFSTSSTTSTASTTTTATQSTGNTLEVSYQCNTSSSQVAQQNLPQIISLFYNADKSSATLRLSSADIPLNQISSASGIQYASDTTPQYIWHTKGNEGLLIIGDQENPDASIAYQCAATR